MDLAEKPAGSAKKTIIERTTAQLSSTGKSKYDSNPWVSINQ